MRLGMCSSLVVGEVLGEGMGAVIENPAEHRFELPLDGTDGEIAAAYYRLESDRLILTHTEVTYQFSGNGIGAQLARGVFEAIRATGRKAVLRRSFRGATTRVIPSIPISWSARKACPPVSRCRALHLPVS